MRQWESQGLGVTEIMKRTGRSKDCVYLHLSRQPETVGRKKLITAAVFRKLTAALQKLQKKAKAEKEVTVAMVKAAAGVEASDRAVLDAFHADDIYFRPLRERPILRDEDIVLRKDFALTYKSRRRRTWLRKPRAIIDCKNWPIFRDRLGRAEAARRMVRGGYRARGDPPKTWLVKQKPTQKFPVKGVRVTAGIVGGKIRMWRYMKVKRWGGAEAAKMYRELTKVLKKTYPDEAANPRNRWSVLEDNDPSGYKSAAGRASKADCRIDAFVIPPRSPDLNPLDYSIWHAISVRMRAQEAKMSPKSRESEEAFKKRLRRVAMTLPKAVVEKAVMDMTRRVNKLHDVQGRLFTE